MAGLEDRFFGDLAIASPDQEQHEDESPAGDDGSARERCLSSANLARWIIDFRDIQMGRQLGMELWPQSLSPRNELHLKLPLMASKVWDHMELCSRASGKG